METINEMCELTPPCECDCNLDKDLSQGNIRPNYSPSPCGADGGVCGEHILEHPLHLWAIKYGVEGHLKFIGVAVVQAPTRSAAECIFAKNSLFSGTPERLKILAMKEVMPWSEPILFEDCAAIIDRHNLKSYPFLLKSDYEHNIQNISDTVIEAVEDYIEHNPFQQINSDWNETDESSKAYILNKPEIPDAQVQSNWNETDTNSKAYILNKPEIPDAQIQSDWSENNASSKAFIRNKPTIPEAQVNADWNETNTGSKSYILNKPTDLVRTSDIEGLLRNDGSVYTGKYLEQVQDLDNFQASEGKIVQYIGETNSKYTNGFIYKKVGTRKVIPAGSEYIDIEDSSEALSSIGIPNGRYYKVIDENDTVKSKIRYHIQTGSSYATRAASCMPVTDAEGGYGYNKPKIGTMCYINSEFTKIVSLTYQGNWIPTFENGVTKGLNGYGEGSDSLRDSSTINIFENIDGIRIYTMNYIYEGEERISVLPLDYVSDEDIYQVITLLITFVYPKNTTSSEQVISDTEWQQWDAQPREDNKQYWNEY